MGGELIFYATLTSWSLVDSAGLWHLRACLSTPDDHHGVTLFMSP
jgi:hypothetical protein